MLSEEDLTQHEHGVQQRDLWDAWAQREYPHLIVSVFVKTLKMAVVQ
jgi:hypothetical protein